MPRCAGWAVIAGALVVVLRCRPVIHPLSILPVAVLVVWLGVQPWVRPIGVMTIILISLACYLLWIVAYESSTR